MLKLLSALLLSDYQVYFFLRIKLYKRQLSLVVKQMPAGVEVYPY